MLESFQWDRSRPLLLGYSGGPDSKALLYALLEAGCDQIHLAHVDHGWRPNSGKEAEELKKEAERLRLPFHAIRMPLPLGEVGSRDARYAFFRSLFQKFPFQALLLAHHAGDVAETALKRVLEGAHLPFLGGMEPVSERDGMVIWRPLLKVKREEILAFLKKRNLEALTDPTNFDPAYLRARMRLEILPGLAATFGKEIFDNLLLLAHRAAELKAYLNTRTQSREPSRGPWGLYGYLGDLERIEARFLIQKWGVNLPRALLETALDAVLSHLPNRRIAPRVYVDRGNLFFLSETPPSGGKEPLDLIPGTWEWGDWSVQVIEDKGEKETNWKEIWSGHFTASAPRGRLQMPGPGSGLRDLWNEKRVPAFFRSLAPLVWREEGKPKEFLTGKILPENSPYFKLVFSTRSRTDL